jgi:hypothetical protein
MTCNIELYFGAMLLQPTWAEKLKLYPRSLEEFAKTFDLKKTVDLAPLTDAQIKGFYKDDAMAAEQMIQLRNKCYGAKKRHSEPGAVATTTNFHKFPVTISSVNRYHCGRRVGEHRLFGPKGVGSVPGMCGPGYGPQCDGCILATAHAPVPPNWLETAATAQADAIQLAQVRLVVANCEQKYKAILDKFRDLQAECEAQKEQIQDLEIQKKRGFARLQRVIEDRGERIYILQEQVLANRKREADVVGVLAGMSESRVEGSYTYVKQAAYHARMVAKKFGAQAEAMRADIVRSAQLTEDREAAAEGAPNEYMCPIGMALMVDPVIVAETGSTYERAAIEEWFLTNNTDPNTNIVLTSQQLATNRALRKLIEDRVSQRAAKRPRFDMTESREIGR